MRKSAILIGFGAFFLAFALLLQFYAYDKLTLIPGDTNALQELNDPSAKFFDAATLTMKQGLVTTKQTVIVDKKATRAQGGDALVLQINQSTDNDGQPPPLDGFASHFAIDRHTGKPLNCCNDYMSRSENGKLVTTPVQHQGFTVKFPLDAGKKSYPYWDNTLRKTVMMKYAGTESIRGLSVNKYTVVVPDTKYLQQKLPGFLFGGAKSSPAVTADRSYANERTIWVEPRTGAYIKVVEHQVITLTDPASGKKVTGIDTRQTMTDKTIKENVDNYKGQSTMLQILKPLPWILGLLGLILLIAGGALIVLEGRKSNRHDPRSGNGTRRSPA